MANFNNKINSGTGFVLCDHEHNYFIYQEDSMEEFRQNVHNYLYFRESSYRLFIQYKTTHCVKKWLGVVSCGITRMETTWQIPATASSCEA